MNECPLSHRQLGTCNGGLARYRSVRGLLCERCARWPSLTGKSNRSAGTNCSYSGVERGWTTSVDRLPGATFWKGGLEGARQFAWPTSPDQHDTGVAVAIGGGARHGVSTMIVDGKLV